MCQKMRTGRLLSALLIGSGLASGCSLFQGQDEESFSSLLSGDYAITQDAVVESDACSQAFTGEPGATLSVHLTNRADIFANSFPLDIELLDNAGTPQTTTMVCYHEFRYDPSTEHILCSTESTLLYQPDALVDAAWPVKISFDAQPTLQAPCNMEYSAEVWDIAGLHAEWRAFPDGECVGNDCDGLTVPTGSDGQPQCIQAHQFDATWEGCGEGESACRPFSSDFPTQGCGLE